MQKLFFEKITGRLRSRLTLAALLILVLASCTAAPRPGTEVDAGATDTGELNEITCILRPGDCLKASVAYLKDGRNAEAAEMLGIVMSSAPSTIWAERASLVYGRAMLEGSIPKGAVLPSTYLSVSRQIEGIDDFRLYYIGAALGSEGDHAGAARTFSTLIERHPDSAVAPRAGYLLAEELEAAGNAAGAAGAYSRYVKKHPYSDRVPDSLAAISRLAFETGGREDALSAARRLMVEFPASRAAGEVTMLPAYTGMKPLGVAERAKRAGNLFRAASFVEAEKEYAGLMDDAAAPESVRVDAAINRVRALTRLRQYEHAEKVLKEIEESKGSALKSDRTVLALRSLIYVRTGRISELKKVERTIAKKYPHGAEHTDSLLFIARHYEQNADFHEAEAAYRSIIDELGGGKKSGTDEWVVAEARWRTGWIAYGGGRYDEAYKVFSEVDQKDSGGMYERFLYWTGRSAERLGRLKEAGEAYTKICGMDPVGYYCLMAGERAEAGVVAVDKVQRKDDEARDKGMDRVPYRLRHAPAYAAATELTTLGFDDDAALTLDRLAKGFSRDRDSLAVIAGMFYSSGDYYRALRLYENHLGGRAIPIDDEWGGRGSRRGQRFLTAEEISHPPGLVDFIRRADPDGRADPYLVAAVMREESRYDADALSRTGAVGLMQIMPETARYIAGRLGRDGFETAELRDPATNVRFGAWYLAHLSERFADNVVLTVAGYNAGPGAAERWVEKLPRDSDEFIEAIPYNETRIYAKRVLKSLAGFRRVTGEGTGLAAGLFGTAKADAAKPGAASSGGGGA